MAPPIDALVERLRRQDASALGEYLAQQRRPLLAFIDKNLGAPLRGKVDVQDIFQDVSLSAWNSLAAGGAIVSPGAEVLTLTPICPHTLSNRSVIVALDSIVQVTVVSERVDTTLTADGQVQMPLSTGDFIQIRKSKSAVRLLRLRGSSFFKTLRQKLHWSGSNI